LKLGTKLTLYLSLIIILVLSGYGYLDILSRRDILIRKMKAEVRTTARTLEASLEKISGPQETKYISSLINTMSGKRILGITVYYPARNLIFFSHSLEGGIEPYLGLIKISIQEDRPQEGFGAYNNVPVFSYTYPVKDNSGNNVGGVSILQNTSSMEEEIEKAKWNIFLTILMVIGGTVALILWGTRSWVARPIAKLVNGVENFAKGNLNHPIDLQRGDEFSELAQAFNQMAVDLKKAQERIVQEAEAQLELERSLRHSEKLATVGQLASELAHEIGTPLNVIHGRAELIQRGVEGREGIQKNLDIIIHQTERITKIIQQLLGFVRKKKPEQTAINICTILDSTLDLLDHQIQKQKISITKDLQDGLPAAIGDPDQLQQVFLNLILNAVQAMPDGGILHLSASLKQNTGQPNQWDQRHYLQVCVEDTGVGIEREAIQHIFSPFFTTKDKGTGLGLMVTQGIIQDHEGWIEVESEVGKGSQFKVYLPSMQVGVQDGGGNE
jgi:two-component system, NtrC family, sensor kinase